MAIHSAIFIKRSRIPNYIYLTIFLISISQVSNSQHTDDTDKPCGVLYSEATSEGMAFALSDQDQSTNLVEDQRASETGWNVTGSIVVENGCNIKVCNETYFDGTCHVLEQGSHSVDQNLFMKDIASARCTCPRQCRCSDIHIKMSTCGRAYLSGGCRTCHALYTDLSANSTGLMFPEDFSDNVEAIRLRKGCKLTYYSDDEFEVEEGVIEEEVVEGFEGEIGSYKCVCDDSQYEPRSKPQRPESYPELINIPESMDDVIKLLSNETYRQHPGLLAARRSYRNGRSPKNAYILLIGSTGAGKSSAINLLFDNPNVTKVGDMISTTSDIHEFRIPVPIDELGIANSELRVIDTPGLGDTRGLEQDAKFLATLDNFLSSHEELKDRIPNVVLVFHKFNDNRFGGEGSQFVKMIRGLDSFSKRMSDEKYSNVIFVFSHFCSVTKTARRKPESRIKQFRQVIQDYSLYPRPTHIVVAENRPRDQELPMVNGYFKLPNNEYYPRNLFEKLEVVTQKGGDTVGLGVFRTAFRNSEDFNVSSSTFNLVATKTDKVGKYLSVLTNANIGVVKTEISQHLEEVWNSRVSAALRKKFEFSLPYLQKALNLRNINQMQDVPRTIPEILNLLTALKHDEATRTLLDKGLGIKSPAFPSNTIAGFSYDVFKDMPLTTSPFKLPSLHQSDIGFMIPTSLSCKLEPGTKEHFIVFDDKKGYLQHRLQNLGIEGSIPVDKFTDQLKPGCNIRQLSFTNESCSITAAKDFRTFEFILNDRLEFTQEFEQTVTALPAFNESDQDVVSQWKNFFSSYGTHVVKSIYGGGSIQITLESNKPFNNDFSQAIFDLLKFAETMDDGEDGGGGSTNRTVLKEGTSQSMRFVGGNPDFHSGDIGKMSVTEASNLLAKWKKSLKFSPAILNTEMRLVPISQIAKKFGQNYTEEIERATRLLFQSELKFTPPPRKVVDPGLDRDNTPIVTEMMRMIKESNDRFHNMTMEMKKAEQENEKKRLELDKQRLEWDKTQKALELEYRNNQSQLLQNEREAQRKFEERIRTANAAHELKMKDREKELEQQRDKAKADADERFKDILKLLTTTPKPSTGGGGGGCLKSGTKILMADMTEKDVEYLRVGDVILDKDLKPTNVLGVTHELLLGQKFYGFENNDYFFTSNHIFVGPAESSLKLYAFSTFELYLNNPLISYLNVTEMGGDAGTADLYHLQKSSGQMSLSTTKPGVVEDPELYPVDTLMYDIQVDSPSGTYIANGYVCRHEIPPVEYWPNTMSIMFRILGTPAFEKLALVPYTVENALKLQETAEDIAEMVEDFMGRRAKLFQREEEQQEQSVIMTLDEMNVQEAISGLFSNPTVATAGVRLYARAGLVIARYLDNENYKLTESQVATLQHELFNFINFELETRIAQL